MFIQHLFFKINTINPDVIFFIFLTGSFYEFQQFKTFLNFFSFEIV